MDILRMLVALQGFGSWFALLLLGVVSLLATLVARSVFRRLPYSMGKTFAELGFYLFEIPLVGGLLVVGLYVPAALLDPQNTPEDYATLAMVVRWACVVQYSAALVLVAMEMWLGRRRRTVWHRPFAWLVLAQVLLSVAGTVASLEQMQAGGHWSRQVAHVVFWPPVVGGVLLGVAVAVGVIALVVTYRTFRNNSPRRPGGGMKARLSWLGAVLAGGHGLRPSQPSSLEDDDPAAGTRDTIRRS